jgi:hypothetical protein
MKILVRWTPERVKEELPDVQVRLADRRTIVTGNVRGRKLQFAVVYLPDDRREEFAWSTLANSLNNGTPLQLL